MPPKDYKAFIDSFCEQLWEKDLCFFHNGWQHYLIKDCAEDKLIKDMPKLRIQIDDYIYEIDATSYVKRMGNFCVIQLIGDPEERWILGTPWLNNFYQVYSIDKNQIGLVPSIYAGDGVTVETVSSFNLFVSLISFVVLILTCFTRTFLGKK